MVIFVKDFCQMSYKINFIVGEFTFFCKKLMKNIIVLLSFLLPISVSAQVAYGGPPSASSGAPHRSGNPTSLAVQINNPAFFNYTTVDELLQPKVISNAFLLKLKSSSSNNTRVFAQIDFGGKRRVVPEHWVSLKLLNKSSVTAIADNNDISLSGYPIL